jgi:hypothetical protein
MFRTSPAWAVIACALSLSATPNSGSTISSSLGNSMDTSAQVITDGPLAQSFTTGPFAYNLTNVTVVLSQNEPTARPKDGIALQSVTVTLWSDNGLAFPNNGPHTLLATSPTTVFGTSLSLLPQTFVFPISFALAANTRYWIEVISPNSDSFAAWWITNNPSGTDISHEYTIIDQTVASTQDPHAFLIGVFGVQGLAATPAPSTVLLVIVGLCGLGLYFRRRGGLKAT